MAKYKYNRIYLTAPLAIALYLSFFVMNYNTHNKNVYNYYELAIQKWCTDNTSYHIHGLWPQIDNASYPTYCANIPYDNNIPPELLEKMNDLWNTCKNNTELWEHEWNKHGTCFALQTGLNQIDFFNITVNLFENIDNTDVCQDKTECIVGCFDLNFKQFPCATKN